jgi:hypothetical protein
LRLHHAERFRLEKFYFGEKLIIIVLSRIAGALPLKLTSALAFFLGLQVLQLA